MISYQDIRDLQQYKSSQDSAVLTVYVEVDQSKAYNLNRRFETAVEDQLRHIADQQVQTENGRPRGFEIERERVMKFLRSYEPKGKGLVIVSDSGANFWWSRDLQVDVATRARWSPQPWVRPLLEILEDRDRLAVVLIDKHTARLLSFDAAGLIQRVELSSDVPNRHHTTGTDHIWSQAQMERDRDKHLKWHARRAASELEALVDKDKPGRIIVGGPVEATSAFESELPKRLQHIVLDTISVPVDIPNDRLAAELRIIQGKTDTEDELRVVDDLITAARKRDRAVLGLDDTLESVHEGRVYRMIVGKSFRAEGSQCASCGVLIASDAELAKQRCGFCGGRIVGAPDLINRMSHKVIERSGRVQLVGGPAAERLGQVGSIGAILRF